MTHTECRGRGLGLEAIRPTNGGRAEKTRAVGGGELTAARNNICIYIISTI